ncbi:MAG: hypothetical protein ABFC94_04075 [Syntrophomonas sp.]
MGQAAKTQIIECNGLAGCGKTTLTKALKDELIRTRHRAMLFGEAYQIFKEHPVKNTIRCLKLPLIFQYIRLFLVIGRNKNYTFYFYVRYIYWAAVRISLVYHWCLKYGEFNYVLCDHGLIQNIISLLGFDELKNWQKIKQCLISVIKAESGIYMVNCNISIEQSRQRIHIRNKNTGRLDLISDDMELKKLLQITENNFFTVRNMVNVVQKEWPIINLEMDKPLETNVQTMLSLLTQGTNKKNEY